GGVHVEDIHVLDLVTGDPKAVADVTLELRPVTRLRAERIRRIDRERHHAADAVRMTWHVLLLRASRRVWRPRQEVAILPTCRRSDGSSRSSSPTSLGPRP